MLYPLMASHNPWYWPIEEIADWAPVRTPDEAVKVGHSLFKVAPTDGIYTKVNVNMKKQAKEQTLVVVRYHVKEPTEEANVDREVYGKKFPDDDNDFLVLFWKYKDNILKKKSVCRKKQGPCIAIKSMIDLDRGPPAKGGYKWQPVHEVYIVRDKNGPASEIAAIFGNAYDSAVPDEAHDKAMENPLQAEVAAVDVVHKMFYTRKKAPDDGRASLIVRKCLQITKNGYERRKHAHDEPHDRATRFEHQFPKHSIMNWDGHREHKSDLNTRVVRLIREWRMYLRDRTKMAQWYTRKDHEEPVDDVRHMFAHVQSHKC